MKIFKIFAILVIVLSTGFLSVGGINFLEKQAPNIEVVNPPKGLGVNPVKLVVRLSDDSAGLNEVVIRTHQKGRSAQILKKKLSGDKEAKVDLILSRNQLKLEEGNAEIEIKVFDSSFFSNASEERLNLVVDYERPSIDVVSVQHNVYQGNLGVILYQVKEKNVAESGVRVGPNRYSGFPARNFDKNLRAENLYLAFYPVDPDYSIQLNDIRAYAKDMAGNLVEERFYNKVLRRKFNSRRVVLRDSYISQLKKLIKDNEKSINSQRNKDNKIVNTFDDLVILEKVNRRKLVKLASVNTDKKWSRHFSAPKGVVLRAYYDQSNYVREKKLFGRRINYGYEFRTRSWEKVIALAPGEVVFAGDLGVYGNSVVVDHGFSLVSVYGYLGELKVKKGDLLKKDQEIAASGNTGMATDNGYYMEFLFQGTSFDPRGLWDRSWYAEHVEKKIRNVKIQFGIPVF